MATIGSSRAVVVAIACRHTQRQLLCSRTAPSSNGSAPSSCRRSTRVSPGDATPFPYPKKARSAMARSTALHRSPGGTVHEKAGAATCNRPAQIDMMESVSRAPRTHWTRRARKLVHPEPARVGKPLCDPGPRNASARRAELSRDSMPRCGAGYQMEIAPPSTRIDI